MSTGRNTTRRDKHRNAIRRQAPPCGICKLPIDYSLPYLDPYEFVVDHVIPLALGGPDTIENKQAAHRTCNRTKGASLEPVARKVIELATSRAW